MMAKIQVGGFPKITQIKLFQIEQYLAKVRALLLED